ncbi:MAG: hypothetical protein JO096_02910 [Alphaproteobacteria bacterium]|nr:hypothetical protein [Alphaproteobacteria bacterium]
MGELDLQIFLFGDVDEMSGKTVRRLGRSARLEIASANAGTVKTAEV